MSVVNAEDLPPGTALNFIALDSDDLGILVASTSFEANVLAATTGTPSGSDRFIYFLDATGVMRAITYSAFVTLMNSALTLTIANDSVTYAKMQNVATNQRIIGRTSGANGDPEELAINTVLGWLSTTRGAVLRYGASGWEGVSPGTSGYVWTSNGAGADPSYVSPTSTANVIAMRDALRNDPAYVSGRQYILDREAAANNGSNIGTGRTRCFPLVIQRPITIDRLGAHISTGSAAGNMRVAIYNHDSTNSRPSTLVVGTGNIATDNTYSIVTTLVDTSGGAVSSIAIDPGLYWAALRVDNATVITTGYGSNTRYGAYVGQAWSSSSDNLIGSSAVGAKYHEYTTGYSFAGNFASLASTSPDASGFSNNNALLIGRAA